jgi:putative ABC transport system substrate-binding protein
VTIRSRDRATVVAVVAAILIAVVIPGEAQPPAKTAKIGFLAASSPEREQRLIAAFKQAFRDLGYQEGKHYRLEQRYAGGRFERLPELVADLLRLKVDVLLAAGAPAAHAAKNATTVVPIVMTNAADPVGTGLVASLARPGGNITGLSDFNEGVVAKRLELLKEVVPAASRVAVLFNPANPTNPIQLRLTQAAARALGITLLPLEAQGPEDIDRAFATIRQEHPGALLVFGDPLLGSFRSKIVELTTQARLPSMYSTKEGAEGGALMGYGADFAELYRRAAWYVDKILKGANPADLPIEQPSKFEFAINLRTARGMGLAVPPAVLFRADRVIQ